MARIIDALEQLFGSDGEPLVNGLLYFFESGSSSMFKPTFADVGETIVNSNPVVLNGDGRCPNVFGSGAYRVILATAEDVQILTRDPVGGDTGLTFGAAWNEEIIYTQDDVVYESGSYWISLTNNNQGNQPSTDGGVNWSAINFGGSAPSTAVLFNHIGGAGTDVLRTDDSAVYPLVRRMAAQGAAFGYDGQVAIYTGEALNELKTQVTYPFNTTERMLLASDNEIRLITNIQGGWAGRVEYVFSTTGTFTTPTLSATTGTITNLTSTFTGVSRAAGPLPTYRAVAAAFTYAAGDLNSTVGHTGTGTITIPNNSSVAFPVGTVINTFTTTSARSLAPAGGVTLNWRQGGGLGTGTRTIAAHSFFSITKSATNVWELTGSGIS